MANTLQKAGKSIVQWAKNFIGGINDTMNYPSVAIWEIWAFLSPKGSKAEKNFKSFADSARWASDIGQDPGSVWYVLWRMAPWIAVLPGMAAASTPAAVAALWTPAVAWLQWASISTLAYPTVDMITPKEWLMWNEWHHYYTTRWQTYQKKQADKKELKNIKEDVKELAKDKAINAAYKLYENANDYTYDKWLTSFDTWSKNMNNIIDNRPRRSSYRTWRSKTMQKKDPKWTFYL